MDCRLPPGLVQVACKKCNLILLFVERHLVLLASFRDACDGFLHNILGGQLARTAAEQGDVICKHFKCNAVMCNGLQIVEIEFEKERRPLWQSLSQRYRLAVFSINLYPSVLV